MTINKELKVKRKNNLKKYDAPLIIQYNKGYNSFKRGYLKSPFHPNTMQHREWQRGFNSAFFENIKRIKYYETRRRGKEIHGQ